MLGTCTCPSPGAPERGPLPRPAPAAPCPPGRARRPGGRAGRRAPRRRPPASPGGLLRAALPRFRRRRRRLGVGPGAARLRGGPGAAAPGRAARAGGPAPTSPTSRSTGSSPPLIAADDGPSLSSFMAKQRHARAVAGVPDAAVGLPPQGGRPAHASPSPGCPGGRSRRWSRSRPTSTAAARPQRMHSELFAGLMRDLGLDAGLRRALGRRPGRGLRLGQHDVAVRAAPPLAGAALGHLAAVEMTSSEPSRRYSAGLRRLGFDERTTVFYDEHVEADAVHEQIAVGRHVRLAGRRGARAAARRPVRCGLLARHGRRRRATTCSAPGRPAAPACGRPALAAWRPALAAASRRPAARRCGAAGRGRRGALGAVKPERLWVPSQNGLMPDLPHRHSAIVSRPGSISAPSWSTSRKSPRTISGPSR